MALPQVLFNMKPRLHDITGECYMPLFFMGSHLFTFL